MDKKIIKNEHEFRISFEKKEGCDHVVIEVVVFGENNIYVTNLNPNEIAELMEFISNSKK